MKHLLLLLATVFALNFNYAQSYQLNYGKNNQAKLTASKNGQNLSTLDFQQDGDQTRLGFDFSGINSSTVTVTYLKNGKPVYENTMDADGGPSVPPALLDMEEIAHESIFSVDKGDLIWFVVAAVALCCVEAQVGSNGWSVGFDCDCFEGASVSTGGNGINVVAVDGHNLTGITEIRVTPNDGEKSALSAATIK